MIRVIRALEAYCLFHVLSGDHNGVARLGIPKALYSHTDP